MGRIGGRLRKLNKVKIHPKDYEELLPTYFYNILGKKLKLPYKIKVFYNEIITGNPITDDIIKNALWLALQAVAIGLRGWTFDCEDCHISEIEYNIISLENSSRFEFEITVSAAELLFDKTVPVRLVTDAQLVLKFKDKE